MNTSLQILHWLAGFVVLAEALNKLERTAPCAPGMSRHARLVDGLKALAWLLLALGAAGALATPILVLIGVDVNPWEHVNHRQPTLAETLVMVGFAVLIVRTRVKDEYPMKRNASQWLDILLHCQVKPAVAAEWAEVFARQVGEGTFSKGDAELDDFLGQILHESAGLTQFTENLHYSAERLCQVWPTRFRSIEEARPFAYNPEALANRVYAGRMGNTQPGDGWKYRGRSPIQLTGKTAYLHISELMGIDLVSDPDLLIQPDYALKAAILWWEDRIPDSLVLLVIAVATFVGLMAL